MRVRRSRSLTLGAIAAGLSLLVLLPSPAHAAPGVSGGSPVAVSRDVAYEQRIVPSTDSGSACDASDEEPTSGDATPLSVEAGVAVSASGEAAPASPASACAPAPREDPTTLETSPPDASDVKKDPPDDPTASAASDDAGLVESTPVTTAAAARLATASDDASGYANMYRLYNPYTGEHFYTASLYEARADCIAGWRWEGIGWVAPTTSGDAVFRLYNPYAGDHHFTLSAVERDHLVSLGWRYEGVGWKSDGSGGPAVYREYNPYARSGSHNYTASALEDTQLGRVGWRREGVAWRAAEHERLAIDGFWLITSAWGSLERYWVDSGGMIATSRLVLPSEGTGYYAYATSSGAVVRGVRDRGNGWAWIAEQNGRLAGPAGGWVVTRTWDSGNLRRYWISDEGGYGLARVGWFERDGSTYYADGSCGYVACNVCLRRSDGWYFADSDGRATRLATGKIGYQNPPGFYQVSAYGVLLPSYAHGYFTYVTPSRIAPDATREQCAEAFVQRAVEYLGTPYRWDYSMQPGIGVDCVGLVMQCAYATGMDLGEFNPYDHMATGDSGWHSHDANNLWNYGSAMHVPVSDRRRGDVISWNGHVAVYVGNDTIIEAGAPGTRVRYNSLWYLGTPRGVIRLFQ